MTETAQNNKPPESAENKNPEKVTKKTFVERIFHEDIEGEYDDQGFFNTPNGSFWDPDGVYFNREGFDKHGGYYDDNNEYVPGKGWDEENNCYKDEIDDEYASDHDPNEDDNEHDGFGDIDMDKIQDEEKLIKVEGDIEKITEDPNKIVHHIDENEKEENKKEENEEKKE